MTKILLCAEGVGDAGRSLAWSARGDVDAQAEGWLQGIIRNVLGNNVSFATKSRRELVLLPRAKNRYLPLPAGHGAKALFAKIIGSNEGFDIVVFMVDADSPSDSEWRAKREEIYSGFEKITTDTSAIACVPKATSESWLLSDSVAWEACGLADLDCLPAQPERRWGQRNDPEGNHPHQEFARACKSADLSDSRETRARLAVATSIETLRKKCPVSFGAFQSDLVDGP